jgi:hypothetical protein
LHDAVNYHRRPAVRVYTTNNNTDWSKKTQSHTSLVRDAGLTNGHLSKRHATLPTGAAAPPPPPPLPAAAAAAALKRRRKSRAAEVRGGSATAGACEARSCSACALVKLAA